MKRLIFLFSLAIVATFSVKAQKNSVEFFAGMHFFYDSLAIHNDPCLEEFRGSYYFAGKPNAKIIIRDNGLREVRTEKGFLTIREDRKMYFSNYHDDFGKKFVLKLKKNPYKSYYYDFEVTSFISID